MANSEILELINDVHLIDLGKTDSPTLYIKEDKYSILTLRYLVQSSNGLENSAVSYLIMDNQFYVVEGDNCVFIENLKVFYNKVVSEVEFLLKIVDHYAETVATVEDCLYAQTNLRTLNTEIFNLKRDSLKLNRGLERIIFVLGDFIKKEYNIIEEQKSEFNDLLADSEVGFRTSKSLLDKLDTCYVYLNSIKNDALNRNIYVLSVISGIFLPLNLIVGFFGMNTTGLFLSNHTNGTSIVFTVIVTIFIFLFIGFPILHFIDKRIVSRLFGSYGVYAKLSKKLEKVTNDFNVLGG